ncbi:MAG: cyclic nucleotide-binding domain-containing protein [Pseudomonadota bacterium]
MHQTSQLLAFHVTERTRNQWRGKLPPGEYRKGQVLFYQGHYPYGVFLIHSGRLELLDHQREVLLPFDLGKGMLIGYELLQTEEPYPYTGIVAENLQASFLDKTLFFDWLSRRSPLVLFDIRRFPAGSTKRAPGLV